MNNFAVNDKVLFVPGPNPLTSDEQRTGTIVEAHQLIGYTCPSCHTQQHWWVRLPKINKCGMTPSLCPNSLEKVS